MTLRNKVVGNVKVSVSAEGKHYYPKPSFYEISISCKDCN